MDVESLEDVYRTTDRHNRHKDGRAEHLNPIPMSPPMGYKQQEPLYLQIRRQVMSLAAEMNNMVETEEEADDFEIEDDPQPQSRWENDTIPSIKEMKARAAEIERLAKLYGNTGETNPELKKKKAAAQDAPAEEE